MGHIMTGECVTQFIRPGSFLKGVSDTCTLYNNESVLLRARGEPIR